MQVITRSFANVLLAARVRARSQLGRIITLYRRAVSLARKRPYGTAFGTLFVLLTVVYFATPGIFRHKVAGDGNHYFGMTRSMVLDLDVDLRNDVTHLATHFKRVPTTGRIAKPYAVGTSILWIPFFVATHAAATLLDLVGVEIVRDGYTAFYKDTTAFGSLVYAFVGLVLCFLVLRRRVSWRAAFWTPIGLYCCSNLLLFSLFNSGYSHACSMFSVALLVWYWDRTYGQQTIWRWLGLGALVGLAALVRPQNVLFAVLPAIEAGLHAARCVRRGEADQLFRQVGLALIATVAALAIFSPQMRVWHVTYGNALTVPQGEGFMVWDRLSVQSLLSSLFWSRNGLLPWNPVFVLCLAGLAVGALRRDRLILFALIGFLAQWWINSSTIDISGGWSFGNRKFINCFVLFAVALAPLAVRFHAWLVKHRQHLPTAAVATLCVVLVSLNLGIIRQLASGKQRTAVAQDMRDVYLGGARAVMNAVWSVTGNPASFPAPWVFAALYDVPPERFDRIVGRYLLFQRWQHGWRAKQTHYNFAHRSSADLVVAGNIVSREGAAASVHAEEGTIEILVPLWFQVMPVEFVATVRMPPGRGPPVCLWNGDEVRIHHNPGEPDLLRFEIPPERVQWGVNTFEFAAANGIELTRIELGVRTPPP